MKNILKISIIILGILLIAVSSFDCVEDYVIAISQLPEGVEECFVEYHDMRASGALWPTLIQVLLACINRKFTKIISFIISVVRTIISMGYLIMLEALGSIGGLYKHSYSFTIWGYVVIGVNITITVLTFILLLKISQKKE